MNVTVVWEARFRPDNANQGQKVLKRIWNDMIQCAGYVDHETIADVDDPGHVVVISAIGARGRPQIESEMNTASILMRSRPIAYRSNPGEGSSLNSLTVQPRLPRSTESYRSNAPARSGQRSLQAMH
jgi:hypothetical protein